MDGGIGKCEQDEIFPSLNSLKSLSQQHETTSWLVVYVAQFSCVFAKLSSQMNHAEGI